MAVSETLFEKSETTDFFYKIYFMVYIFGLPNCWIEDLKLTKSFVRAYDRFTLFNNALVCTLIFTELLAVFTQHNLSQKQQSNFLIYCLSHPMLYGFRVIMATHEEKVKTLLYNLTVVLKRVHNDPEVEKQMIRSAVMYLFALCFSCALSMFMYTFDAGWEMMKYNATFTTLVTAYPDVEDRSELATSMRVLANIVWWIFFTRIIGVYILVIPLATCLGYQFKNLQSYFLSLADIFERDNLSQKRKEEEYEERFKIGIKMHLETLRCTRLTQTVCNGVYSGQIIFNILILVALMSQMANSERTLVNICSTVFTATAVLISTGFYMWNAGDVTVEASHLATAMFFSGWHHCRGMSSRRIRNLVVVAIAHAQSTNMTSLHGPYKKTKTTDFLFNLNKFGFIFGLPNFWVEEINFPWNSTNIIRTVSKFGNMAIFVLMISEYLSFFTQKNLTEQQFSDLIFYIISHTITTGFRVRVAYQREEIRDVMYKLGIVLKDIYNDSEIEDQMIARTKFFSLALIINCFMSMVMYGVQAVLKVIRSGMTFTTVITAWPDVEDDSALGNVLRCIFYIFWWIFLTRIFSVYTLVISLTIAVSHQFKNLISYFHNLNKIFDDENNLTQKEKEQAFEDGFKVGIKLHSETLKCTNQVQTVCADVFSGQIIFSLTLLTVMMVQMMNSPRTLTNVMTLVVAAFTVLFSTGFFMWNAGDITVEANNLPTAMFSSGWENCYHGSSIRVRKLVVIAIMEAQQPVVLTGLRVIPLSYQSYVSVFINPKLKVLDYHKVPHTEACESIQGYLAEVPRYISIEVSAMDAVGDPFSRKFRDWTARVAQHEMDHLDGRLYTDVMDRKTLTCACWKEVNLSKGKVAIPLSPR
ncbi:unnamed protein product [Chrysodeixis includens]|uniref:peptide deformylase n=1 Tax=Chrysodeixis includens TaxID=689277 RepID=A0A9N8KV64_CHRIL|nr:unnamed protein product [Chrysodeixis includens]